MIRFALKSAFWLGILAFAIPFVHGETDGSGAKIDVVGAVVGAQQALSDLGGFCERAPQACVAGREMAAFAGERIEEGARIAYGLVNESIEGGTPAAPQEAIALRDPDPVTTGAVEPLAVGPQPYQAPRRDLAPAALPIEATPQPAVPMPTPRP